MIAVNAQPVDSRRFFAGSLRARSSQLRAILAARGIFPIRQTPRRGQERLTSAHSRTPQRAKPLQRLVQQLAPSSLRKLPSMGASHHSGALWHVRPGCGCASQEHVATPRSREGTAYNARRRLRAIRRQWQPQLASAVLPLFLPVCTSGVAFPPLPQSCVLCLQCCAHVGVSLAQRFGSRTCAQCTVPEPAHSPQFLPMPMR